MSTLNEKQIQAVETTEGPLLLLAGAGSGKTTVLVNRIAHIINNELAKPWSILAITFTNKAANELKERIERHLESDASGIWACTFHTACLKFLRKDIDKIGYKSDFTIYDRADQLTLIKEAARELNIDEKLLPPKAILNEIGRAKDRLKRATNLEAESANDFRRNLIAKAYTYYQNKLRANNALDFDDMIMLTVELFEKFPEVLEFYQKKFRYILVDEYQDTNHAQYRLISLLAEANRNICVVGDDDQSIYKFRGANIENILNFENEYSDVKVIKLEQNYRSTQTILNAANSVIKNNAGRKGKVLWTNNNKGEKICIYTADNEFDEGRFIAEKIEKLHLTENVQYNDFAILYRMNSQSRVIEETFIKSDIPYKIIGGLRFYDRKEIKDIAAYFRLIHNINDDVSLSRIINEPKRGIGKTTFAVAAGLAADNSTSIFDIISRANDFLELSRASTRLLEFVAMVAFLREKAAQCTLAELFNELVHRSGYISSLQIEKTIENQTRLENLQEFLSIIESYEKTTEDSSLSGFLESIALYSDMDNYAEDDDAVVLMTLHTAKGLEFPVVFMVGMEDGIFPGFQNMFSESEMEEERRLCYVGITRAKKCLFLSHAKSRTIFGNYAQNKRSCFIDEIDSSLLEDISRKKSRIGVTSRQSNGYVPFMQISNSKKKSVDFALIEGQRVKHKKFGAGFIVSIKNDGEDHKLEIAFDEVGTKHLMAAFANLEVE